MSKSKGTFIRASTYLKHLDPSLLRYYYASKLTPRVDDLDIDPDPGSSNPFRAGVRRDVEPRAYTVTIANGTPPNPRPRHSPGRSASSHAISVSDMSSSV